MKRAIILIIIILFSRLLAAWGFFNRVIVQQWSNQPVPYPVYRLGQRPPAAMLSE